MSNDFRTEKNPVTTICKLGLGFYFGKLLKNLLYFVIFSSWHMHIGTILKDSSESKISTRWLDCLLHLDSQKVLENRFEGVF